MKFKNIILVLGFFSTLSLIAQNRSQGGTGSMGGAGKRPLFKGAATSYGDAGCGLGSVIVGSEPGVKQILAATLNSTGVQTFALTTGTSNCENSKLFARADKFIETNREELSKESARGAGETIEALAVIYGCQDKEFGSFLQKNYSLFFLNPHKSAKQIDEIIRSSLKRESGLVCDHLG